MEVAEVFLFLVSYVLQSAVKGDEADEYAKKRKIETDSQASTTSSAPSAIKSQAAPRRLTSFSDKSTTCETGPTTDSSAAIFY